MKEINEYGDKLVDYDVAILADVVGYDVYSPECFTTYRNVKKEDNIITDSWTGLISEDEEFLCYRPTQTGLQKWIREKHGLEVYCKPALVEPELKEYYVGVEKWDNPKQDLIGCVIEKTYEKALEKGLEIALNIIKTYNTNVSSDNTD